MPGWQLVDNIRKSRVGLFWQSNNMDLIDILPEFQAFLREQRIVHEKSIPYFALWVSKFLNFVNKNPDGNIASQILAFMGKVKADQRVKDWQVRNPNRL